MFSGIDSGRTKIARTRPLKSHLAVAEKRCFKLPRSSTDIFRQPSALTRAMLKTVNIAMS